MYAAALTHFVNAPARAAIDTHRAAARAIKTTARNKYIGGEGACEVHAIHAGSPYLGIAGA
jgi:hypothetical protein